MSIDKFTPLVKRLPTTVPFVGPEAQERAMGRLFRARIGANENVFGPSPKAVAAMQKAAGEVWMYGDPENHDLKQAIAAHHNIKTENVVVGEGIDALLGYTVRMYMEEGGITVTSLGAYPTFNYHVTGHGGELVMVPYVGDFEDRVALLEAARKHHVRMIYLANPDNPMGTYWKGSQVQEMIDALPEESVLVLDEAYIEFAPDDAAPPLDVSNPNVLRYRTFSKAYAMAGARVGYAIGEENVIKSFDKVRDHFGLNRVAQAGALAALKDQEWLSNVVENVSAACARIAKIAEANGLEALPTAANFVAIDCGADGDFARKVYQALTDDAIFVRMPAVAPQDRCVRISAGSVQDLDCFEAAFPKALATAKEQ
ncbi:MAG: pyridoxal phosphate-dependent aminotransferase [Hyphomicrobiales bacterium]